MTELFIFCICFLVVSVLQFIDKIRMQKTIDRLSEKLMARDYGEYKRYSGTLMREERPERKPISFYDDPSIEVEDEAQ